MSNFLEFKGVNSLAPFLRLLLVFIHPIRPWSSTFSAPPPHPFLSTLTLAFRSFPVNPHVLYTLLGLLYIVVFCERPPIHECHVTLKFGVGRDASFSNNSDITSTARVSSAKDVRGVAGSKVRVRRADEGEKVGEGDSERETERVRVNVSTS